MQWGAMPRTHFPKWRTIDVARGEIAPVDRNAAATVASCQGLPSAGERKRSHATGGPAMGVGWIG
jgi:hypothetical protein